MMNGSCWLTDILNNQRQILKMIRDLVHSQRAIAYIFCFLGILRAKRFNINNKPIDPLD